MLNGAVSLEETGGKTGLRSQAPGSHGSAHGGEPAAEDPGGTLTEAEAAAYMNAAAEQVPVGSNMRGSREYRSHLARVLGRRGLMELQKLASAGKGGAEL